MSRFVSKLDDTGELRSKLPESLAMSEKLLSGSTSQQNLLARKPSSSPLATVLGDTLVCLSSAKKSLHTVLNEEMAAAARKWAEA